MRIALLADIHSNLEALQAVTAVVEARAPDVVVVAGDVINRGPQPRAALDFVLRKQSESGWRLLKGNHEDFVVLESVADRPRTPWEVDLHAHTAWTYARVRDVLPLIAALPDELSLEGPDGGLVRFVHGSMRGNRVGIYHRTPDEELDGLIAPPPALLGVGHTHVPLVRDRHGTRVVNCGAVGLPFDGIVDARFAWLEWREGIWHVDLVRVPYRREVTLEAFESSGYLADGGVVVPLILEELRTARAHVGPWHRRYEARVASGEIAIADSMRMLLEECRRQASAVSSW